MTSDLTLLPQIYRLNELYTLRFLTADPATGAPHVMPEGFEMVQLTFNANRPESMMEFARWQAWDVETAEKPITWSKLKYEFSPPTYLVHRDARIYLTPIVDLSDRLAAHAHASALARFAAIDRSEADNVAAQYRRAKAAIEVLREGGADDVSLDTIALRFGKLALGLR